LRIISQFNDDDDEYFPHTNRPPEVSKGLLSPALPVGFGLKFVRIARRLRSVSMPTLCVISPARIGLRARPFRAIDVAVSVQLLACSFHGNFGLTTPAAVSDLHRL
jgi:hypothetical protein